MPKSTTPNPQAEIAAALTALAVVLRTTMDRQAKEAERRSEWLVEVTRDAGVLIIVFGFLDAFIEAAVRVAVEYRGSVLTPGALGLLTHVPNLFWLAIVGLGVGSLTVSYMVNRQR